MYEVWIRDVQQYDVIGLWNLPGAEAHRQTSSLTLLELQDLAEETPKNPESFFHNAGPEALTWTSNGKSHSKMQKRFGYHACSLA